MTDPEYTYSYKDGTSARWVRSSDAVRYYRNGNLDIKLVHPEWDRMVEALGKRGPLPIQETVGEIVAWRVWTCECGFLRSVYRDTVWVPGHPMTGHVGEEDGGVYSFRDKGHAVAVLKVAPHPAFLGSVDIWGDVMEHADGYRSEYAAIRSLEMASDPKAAAMLSELRRRYEVAGDGTECLPKRPTMDRRTRVTILCLLCIAFAFGDTVFTVLGFSHSRTHQLTLIAPNSSKTFVGSYSGTIDGDGCIGFGLYQICISSP